MKPAKILQLSAQPTKHSEFDKDIWDRRKLGADIRPSDKNTIWEVKLEKIQLALF